MESTQDVSWDGPEDIRTRTRRVSTIQPNLLFTVADPPYVYFADRDGREFAGAGAIVTLTGSGHNDVSDLSTRGIQVLSAVDYDGPAVARPRLFGGLSFDQRSAGESWTGFDGATFFLPACGYVIDDADTWLYCSDEVATGHEQTIEDKLNDLEATVANESAKSGTSKANGLPSIDNRTIQPPRDGWIKQVQAAIDHIETSPLEKVVLATKQTVELDAPVDPTTLLTHFNDQYPDCYRFLFRPRTGGTFLGPTPERLVRVADNQIESEALAGSIERGETATVDEQNAIKLADDTKTRTEQTLVVEAVREVLDTYGDVTVGDRTVRKLANIQHLLTPIAADIDSGVHVLDVVSRLHPTPAVGGWPQTEARETIADLEPFNRGWYAGPIGWFDADGNGEFAVAIRSGVVKDRTITMYAGNGIVAESDPAAEWDEVQPKYRPILDAFE